MPKTAARTMSRLSTRKPKIWTHHTKPFIFASSSSFVLFLRVATTQCRNVIPVVVTLSRKWLLIREMQSLVKLLYSWQIPALSMYLAVVLPRYYVVLSVAPELNLSFLVYIAESDHGATGYLVASNRFNLTGYVLFSSGSVLTIHYCLRKYATKAYKFYICSPSTNIVSFSHQDLPRHRGLLQIHQRMPQTPISF